MLISARLFPLKARIEVVWRNQLEEEKFSSWKILKLYSLYCRRIINDTQGANIVDSYIAVLGERLREAKDINYRKPSKTQSLQRPKWASLRSPCQSRRWGRS